MEGTDSTQETEDALPTTVEEVTAWVAATPARDVEVQAGWWLRDLATTEAKIAALDAREEGELARIRAHYARYRAPLTERAGALERSLEAVAELVTYPKGRKSLPLAYGTIGRRTVAARVVVGDAMAAVETARQLLPSAIRTKESVDVRAITPVAMAVLADGGVLPGFGYEPEHETAYAKVNSLAASEGA